MIVFEKLNETEIELSTFIKVETPYDNLFKHLVDSNVLVKLRKTRSDDYEIYKMDVYLRVKEA